MKTNAELDDIANKVLKLLDVRKKALRKKMITLVCLYMVTVIILFVGASL